MARRKIGTNQSPHFKNIIAQAFGSFLKRERNNMKLSHEQISNKVHVSGSYYRLIESGGAVFNPTRAFDLIDLFQNIEWEPLIKLLVVAQMLEGGLSSWRDLEVHIQRLSEKDAQLEKLFSNFKPIWELEPKKKSSEIDQIIEGNEIYFSLREYLMFNKYFQLSENQKWEHRIKDIVHQSPSLFLDYSLNSLQSLIKLPINFSSEDMHKWESENKNTFKDIYGVISDYKGITSDDNLKKYKYEFLCEPTFDNLNYIFLTEENTDKIREEFLSGLKKNNSYNDNQLKTIRHKVHFKNLSDTGGESIRNLLVFNNTPYQNFWIWRLNNDMLIGFSSEADSKSIKSHDRYKKTPIRNLSFQEVNERRNELIKYWENK